MARRDEELNDSVYSAAIAASQEKPVYPGTFDQQLAELYQKISTRPDFKYDVRADPLYQQYKDQYMQQGKLAMRDTMGKAAGLTGGYGSTYGQSVGQQAYDASLKDLAAAIPELYGVAYDKYKDDGDLLLRLYGLAGDQRDTEYGRFRDEMKDWESDREFQRQVETEEYNRRTAEQRALEQQRQQLYTNLYAMIKASGYRPTDAELQAAGMTREAADAVAAEYQRGVEMENRAQELKEWQVYNSGSGGSSGGGRSGSSGGGYWTEPDANNVSYWIAPTEDDVTYPGYYSGSVYKEEPITINQYGEQRFTDSAGNPTLTRGEIERELRRMWSNGEITYEEYQQRVRALH